MSIGLKVLFTVLILILAIAFSFVNTKAGSAEPDSFWRGGRGGRGDLMRNMIFRDDGKMRKYTKPLSIAFWIAGLFILWLVVP